MIFRWPALCTQGKPDHLAVAVEWIGSIGDEDQAQMPKTCPTCGLLNPDTSLLCDCGFPFTQGETVGGPGPHPRWLTISLKIAAYLVVLELGCSVFVWALAYTALREWPGNPRGALISVLLVTSVVAVMTASVTILLFRRFGELLDRTSQWTALAALLVLIGAFLLIPAPFVFLLY